MSDEETNDNSPEASSPSNSPEPDGEFNLNRINTGKQFTDDLATLSESFQKIQVTQIDSISDALQPFRAIQKAQAAEVAKSLQPTQAIQQAQINKIIEPLHTLQEIHRLQITPIAEQIQKLSRIQAEIAFADFPDEVFTTAIAASTVSAHAQINPSSPTTTPSTSTSDPSIDVEPASNPPSVEDIPAWSLYLEAAITLGVYLSYKIEGLNQSQRDDAATLLAGAIVFGATPYLPVSETPLVAGSATIGVTEILLNLLPNEE